MAALEWMKKLYQQKPRCLRGQDVIEIILFLTCIGGIFDSVIGHKATCLPILDCDINPLGDARCARHKENKIVQKISLTESMYLSDDCMENNTLGLVLYAYIFVMIGAIVGLALQNLWLFQLPDESLDETERRKKKKSCSNNENRGSYQEISHEENEGVEQPKDDEDMTDRADQESLPNERPSVDEAQERRKDENDIEVVNDVKDGTNDARSSDARSSDARSSDARSSDARSSETMTQEEDKGASVNSARDEQQKLISKLHKWFLWTNCLSTIYSGVGSSIIITHVFMALTAPFPCKIGENITLSVNYTSISCTLDNEVGARILYMINAVLGLFLTAYTMVAIIYVICKIYKKRPNPLNLRPLLSTEKQAVNSSTGTSTTTTTLPSNTESNPSATNNSGAVPDTQGIAHTYLETDPTYPTEVDHVKT